MKEFAIRSIDGSKSTEEGFKAIGLNAKTMADEFGKGGDAANSAFKKTLDGLANLKDPVERETAGVALFGTMWEDMGQDAMLALADVEGGLENVDGASEAVLQKQREQREFTSVLREFQMALMPIGTEIMKIAKDCLPQVREIIGDVSEAIGNLTDEQKENILKWGGIAIAAGPVIKTVGGAVQIFGGVGKAFSGLNTVMKDTKGFETAKGAVGGLVEKLGVTGASGGSASLMGSMAALALPAGLAAGALGIVGLAAKGTADWLNEEAIPAVDLFAEETVDTTRTYKDSMGEWQEASHVTRVQFDEDTKANVQSYVDMRRGILDEYQAVKTGQLEITDELKEGVEGKVNKINELVKTKAKERHDKSIEDIKTLFTDANGNVEEGYDLLKESEDRKLAESNTSIDENSAKVTELLKAYYEQGGVWIGDQEEQFNTALSTQGDIAVTALTKTEEQRNVIMSRIQANDGRMNAEMAQKSIEEANKATEGEIFAANEKFRKKKEIYEQKMKEDPANKKEYERLLGVAEKERDDEIQAAKDTNKGIKEEIEKATPELVGKLDYQTGELLKPWTRFKNSVIGMFNSISASFSEMWMGTADAREWYGGDGVADNYQRDWNHNYNGQSYVPYDGYIGYLHKGERVLTAEENYRYTQNQVEGNNRSGIEVNLYGISNAEEIASVLEEKLIVMGLT